MACMCHLNNMICILSHALQTLQVVVMMKKMIMVVSAGMNQVCFYVLLFKNFMIDSMHFTQQVLMTMW